MSSGEKKHMAAEEQIAVLMSIADEAREQAEYHAREAAKALTRAEAVGLVVARLVDTKPGAP